MPSLESSPLVLSDFSRGRAASYIGGPTSPFRAPNQAVEMLNVDLRETAFGHRRNGISAASVAFGAGGPFTGKIATIIRHVPGPDDTLAEMWAIDNAATPVWGRKAGATTFTAPTLTDAMTGAAWLVSGASLNGLLFLAYGSAQARLHVWDPVNARVRRTGFAVPVAPTVANTGAGAYAAVIRYYRVRWTEQQTGVTVRRSEPGASVSFTPSGAGTAARITQPAVASEQETHWEVEASTDNVTFYLLTTVVIGTTTYDDSAATTTYASGTASAVTGTYTNQKPYKFIAADQNRLLGFGSWTTTDKQNRVEFSGVVGSLNVGDTERVNTTVPSYVDLDENDSGDPTGLAGPIFGNYYAFKTHQVWELRPSGDTAQPYFRSPISKVIGAVGPRAYCVGEDEQGRSVLYFMSHQGPYRLGSGGLQYIGHGIEDITKSPTGGSYVAINLAATINICHMVYYATWGELWVWLATGSSNTPNKLLIYHVRYQAWTQYNSGGATGKIENALCSCMFSDTIGATMSKGLVPYHGSPVTVNVIFRDDDPAQTTDTTTTYQAYVLTPWLRPWGPGWRGRTGDGWLIAAIQAGVTISVIAAQEGLVADSARSLTGTALLTLTGSEVAGTSFATRAVEGIALGDCEWVQYQIGDSAAVDVAAWRLFSLTVPWARTEPLVNL